MPFCSKCQNPVSSEDQWEFCYFCGAPLEIIQSTTKPGTHNLYGTSAKKLITNNTMVIGIVILLIGVALIIISPSFVWTETVPDFIPGRGQPQIQITDSRNVVLFFGVAQLVVGGIISAVGFNQFRSAQPTTQSTPTTQLVVTQSVSPKSIELGSTSDEVQSVMGHPDKIINLGGRVIHVYKDMKIIYIDDKVSDVQLS